MKRRSNWPRLLADFLREKAAMPFDWRHNNCAFLAADWVVLCTGVDPAADLRERVDGPLAAGRLLRDRGGLAPIVGEVCARWEWLEIQPALAQRGDVAFLPTAQGDALAIVIGARVVATGKDGLVTQPLKHCTAAWRIG